MGRWSKERCAERAIERVAALEWSPGMRIEGSGADAVALFRLTAHPTGRDGSFTIDTVTGTPLYTSADGDFWTVDEKVTGTGPDTTVELPAQPARCDIHAFGSATGGTTFFVNVTIDGRTGAGTDRDEPRGHRRGVLLRRRGVWLLMGGFPWTARTRRLIFVVVMLVVLTFPLVTSLVTRAQIERSGVDVTATVIQTTQNGDAFLVAFRLPEEIDPDQDNYSAEVDQATYEKAAASKEIGVRVLEDRPEAHRVEGEIRSKAPYVMVAVADALVLGVGLWWVRAGRRRPTVRIRANSPLEPADPDEPGSIARQPDDAYEAVGTVLSADDAEVVLDIGERQVVITLAGYDNPVPVGSPARARGPIIG